MVGKVDSREVLGEDGQMIPKPSPSWTFEDFHREGAKAFGWRWVVENQRVILGAYAIDEDPTTKSNKRLLSAVAYTVLAAERAEGQTRSAEALVLLRKLVADDWAGWGWDDGLGCWSCFWCRTKGETDSYNDPPDHAEDCPVVRARKVIASYG